MGKGCRRGYAARRPSRCRHCSRGARGACGRGGKSRERKPEARCLRSWKGDAAQKPGPLSGDAWLMVTHDDYAIMMTHLPLKKMPSTQAKATSRSAKLSLLQ